MALLRAVDLASISAADVGVYVRHSRFLYVVTPRGLHATLVCGAIDEDAAHAICAVWGATTGAAPHPSLFDATDLVTADPRAFGIILKFLTADRTTVSRDVRRQAIVGGPTLGAAMVLGYYTMFPPPFPIQTFERRGGALTWLGRADDEAVLSTVERDLGRGTDAAVAALRERLDAEPLTDLTLTIAARWLSTTPRTLQRRLSDNRTDFTAELSRARVARAQRLMLDPERNVTAIALDVGCSSSSSFSELFRRLTGETPTAWRRRNIP